MVVSRAAKTISAHVDRVLKSREVVAITLTEGLTAAIDFVGEGVGRLHFEGQAAAHGKNGREGPATEDVADNARLALVNRRLIDDVSVEEELAIPGLHTVSGAQVEGVGNGELAGGLNFGPRAERLAVGEVALRGDAVPIRHPQGDEARIVITPAHTGVRSITGGHLRTEWRTSDRSVEHAAGEIEVAGIQIFVKAEDLVESDITRTGVAFISGDGLGTARVTGAIRGVEGCFEERLWSDSSQITGATTAGEALGTAAILPNHLAISLGEGLAALGEHVRNGVEVNGLEFVSGFAADIAEFDGDAAIKLTLNGEIELLAHAGPEVRIENFAGGSRDAVEARENRLRQRRGAVG